MACFHAQQAADRTTTTTSSSTISASWCPGSYELCSRATDLRAHSTDENPGSASGPPRPSLPLAAYRAASVGNDDPQHLLTHTAPLRRAVQELPGRRSGNSSPRVPGPTHQPRRIRRSSSQESPAEPLLLEKDRIRPPLVPVAWNYEGSPNEAAPTTKLDAGTVSTRPSPNSPSEPVVGRATDACRFIRASTGRFTTAGAADALGAGRFIEQCVLERRVRYRDDDGTDSNIT